MNFHHRRVFLGTLVHPSLLLVHRSLGCPNHKALNCLSELDHCLREEQKLSPPYFFTRTSVGQKGQEGFSGQITPSLWTGRPSYLTHIFADHPIQRAGIQYNCLNTFHFPCISLSLAPASNYPLSNKVDTHAGDIWHNRI